MPDSIVIVGAGQCGGQAADALLRAGFGGRLVLLGDEPHPPYQRPPLSKQLLAGEIPVERTFLKPPAHWSDKGVDLRLGRRAERLDTARQTLTLDDDSTLAYDRLLLATGSRPRRLPLAGIALDGIHDLRTLDDAARIRPALTAGARVVVVGGGFIGLEVAAVARKLDAQVTVLEAADRLLPRVVPPAMSAWYEALHRRHGVTVHTGAKVSGFEGTHGRVTKVMVDGEALEADLVIMGVGIVPNQELAAEAGIDCDDGILVDARCATSAPDVYAAGDCTRHPNALLNVQLRLESVHNATAQARVAAANLLGGNQTYAEIPWFWSDQYDVKLQMVGLSAGHDRAVVRGDMDAAKFTVFYLEDGVLVAADAVNNAREFMACRKLVPELKRVDPDQLADPGVDLKDLI